MLLKKNGSLENWIDACKFKQMQVLFVQGLADTFSNYASFWHALKLRCTIQTTFSGSTSYYCNLVVNNYYLIKAFLIYLSWRPRKLCPMRSRISQVLKHWYILYISIIPPNLQHIILLSPTTVDGGGGMPRAPPPANFFLSF